MHSPAEKALLHIWQRHFPQFTVLPDPDSSAKINMQGEEEVR